MKGKHILVFRFSALGDVAMCVPVLRCLLQTYPELQITIVTRKRFVPLFETLPNVQFFTPDFMGEHKGIAGLYRLFKSLKKLRPTAIADLHQVLRTQLLMLYFRPLFWIKQALINKGRAEKKRLTRQKPKTLVPLLPQVHRYAQVFEKLGFPLSLSAHEFPPRPICPNTEALQLAENRKWIGIAPFAAHTNKQYPLDLMQQVVAFLQQEHQVILFGFGKEEHAQLDVWANAYKHVANATGIYAFAAELRLIAQLDLMISMDSANGHLAANYNVPVLTLWGNTHPCLGFAPFEQPQKNSLTPDLTAYPLLPTSVYGNKKVKGYQDAMRSIAPKTVIEFALEVLGGKMP
ncbi:MAG: glycosyltransferase family 9 protein [Flavobacteriales bacterium]|nr:MAG: glycosyltransferase family 9 protein [Flavobacteriales bacterium]|tara:strand:+ start:804 stop:1844 length:1041 start_codon:yes stop_codon:yes gene_type:complete